jgi:hypothetical protein
MGGEGSEACTVRIIRSLGRYGSEVSGAAKFTGGGQETDRESQLKFAEEEEQSCSRTLHREALGFTAGGSGWESRVAPISSAPRIQIASRIDLINRYAPDAHGNGFSAEVPIGRWVEAEARGPAGCSPPAIAGDAKISRRASRLFASRRCQSVKNRLCSEKAGRSYQREVTELWMAEVEAAGVGRGVIELQGTGWRGVVSGECASAPTLPRALQAILKV